MVTRYRRLKFVFVSAGRSAAVVAGPPGEELPHLLCGRPEGSAAGDQWIRCTHTHTHTEDTDVEEA